MSRTDEADGGKANQPTIPVICDRCKAEGQAGEGGFEGIADILDFEPVPRRSQVNSWTAELQRAFIAALAITGSARRAGKAIGRHEHGAEKLRAARGGKSFAAAWDAALDIYRDREMAQLGGQLAGISRASLEQVQKMDLKPGETDEEEGESEYEEAQGRIRERLLNARRLYLLSICLDEKKRAAWETLVGPVDWDRAAGMQPQANEPFRLNMRAPDMLMTAEGGCVPELVGADRGRDRGAEFMAAMDEIKETGETDGPKASRFFSRDAERNEQSRSDT